MQQSLSAKVVLGYMVISALFLGLWPVGSAASVEATWKRQTSGITNSLRATTFYGTGRALAVGGDGTILASSDGGTTWTRQQACGSSSPCAPNSGDRISALFHGASSLANGDTYVVGTDGMIIKQTAGSTAWSPPQFVCLATSACVQNSADKQAMAGIHLRGVHYQSSSLAVAVGAGGTIIRTENSSGWVMRPSGVTATLNAVWMPSSEVGWAVGEQGTILKTSDGGLSWAPQFACQTSTTCTAQNKMTKTFNAAMFVSSTEGYVVGDDGTILYTTNAGETWSVQNSNTTQHLNDVYFIAGTGFAVGAGGTMLATSNSGATWAPMFACSTSDPCTSSSPDRVFQSIHSIGLQSPTVGTAVGGEGLILGLGAGTGPSPIPTGPSTWTLQATDVTSALRSTSFVNPSTGLTVGSDGTILGTTDGGTTWTRFFACASGQSSGSGCTATSSDRFTIPLNGVTAANANDAVAVGGDGFILKTTNAGVTWNRIVGCRVTAPNCNSSSNSTDRVATSLEAIHGVSSGSLTTVGADGTILFSDNGGQSWSARPTVTNQALHSVWFTSVDTGYAVGDNGTILKTSNKGETWSPQFACTGTGTCIPGSSAQVRQRLNSVMFSTTGNGVIVGDGGMILTTTNGGEQWVSQTSGTQQNLYGVFLTGSSGYAVGSSGTLLTTTNGTSWTPAFACRNSNPCGTTSSDRIFHTLNAVVLPASNIGNAVGQDGIALRLAPYQAPTTSPSATPTESGSPAPSVQPSGSPTPSTTPSASPTAAPKVDAFVTIKYRKRRSVFKGLIASEDESCWQGRKIKVKKTKKGRDRTVASATSNGSGKWSTRMKRKPPSGRYYAVAIKHVTTAATCVPSRSRRIRI